LSDSGFSLSNWYVAPGIKGANMDPQRFDDLAQRLAQAASRRTIVGGSLAALLALTPIAEQAEAKKGGKGKGKGKSKGKGKGKRKGKGKKKGQNGDNGNGQTKVLICHNGNTIEVAEPAVSAHLAHGDTLGACTTSPPPTCTSPRTQCGSQCVDLQTDEDNCGQCGRACGPNEVCNNGLACQAAACLPVTGTEGNVSPASNGDVTATTTGAANFGNLVIDVPNNTTFEELESMSAQFAFTTGVCGGGAPRFVVFLESGNCPYATFPTDNCDTEGAAGNTGELIGNNDDFVWIDDLQCTAQQPPAAIHNYEDVLDRYTGVGIAQIVLVVDTSPVNTERTVTLDPCVTIA
jgi:hypothetical protein